MPPIEIATMCSGKSVEEIEHKISLASQSGFRRVQVTMQKDGECAEWRQIFEICRMRRVRLEAMGCYMSLLEPRSGRLHGVSIEGVRSAIAAAAGLDPDVGERRFVVWSGTFGDGLLDEDPRNYTWESWQAAKETVLGLMPSIAAIGGRLLIEPYYTHLLGRPRDFTLFFRDVERARKGFTIWTPGSTRRFATWGRMWVWFT